VIAAKERAVMAIARGLHLRTSSPAVVNPQNWGMGNIVNPLLSLADPDDYGTVMGVIECCGQLGARTCRSTSSRAR
jgi:phosphonopyruvate decarboxylase